eukprot:TRINITY_DN29618_c0_g1_i3.p1 TRINITY_DN29618_c0_g1~~TRINITY_DN29618_c0_g1_i3.p1  ORF type:complete len:192 (-),score=66.15 TRINITY_DN29618_c0_g1_i3:245-820(-)
MAPRRSVLPAVAFLLFGACVVRQVAFLTPSSNAVGRREALQVAGAVATMGVSQAAWADAQGEPIRSLSKYGPAILGLKDAVASGDMTAVLKKENKFKLLNGYWRNDAEKYSEKAAVVEKILDAAAEGRVQDCQNFYNEYISDDKLQLLASLPPQRRGGRIASMAAYGANKYESDPEKTAKERELSEIEYKQ